MSHLLVKTHHIRHYPPESYSKNDITRQICATRGQSHVSTHQSHNTLQSIGTIGESVESSQSSFISPYTLSSSEYLYPVKITFIKDGGRKASSVTKVTELIHVKNPTVK